MKSSTATVILHEENEKEAMEEEDKEDEEHGISVETMFTSCILHLMCNFCMQCFFLHVLHLDVFRRQIVPALLWLLSYA